MATFSHEVSPYKRRDGTYLVKVRMTQRRKTVRKPTGIYATPDQLTRDRKRIKDPALLAAVNAAIDSLRMAAAKVDGAEYMEADHLWQCITARMEAERGFRLDVYEFAQTVTATMERGTADGYRFALNALRSYTGKETLDINDIDKTMVVGFREWIEKRNGKGCRASSAYLEKLRTIHNRARDLYNDDDAGLVRIPRQPFKGGIIPPQPSTRHRALSLDQLRKVLACEPATPKARMARDVFTLSFALVGMNTADLHRLRKGDLRHGLLTYQRAKTDSRRSDKAEMVLRVEPEAADIIGRWKGTSKLLSCCERFSDFRNFTRAVDQGLKEVGAMAGVPGLTTYHARHTWATLARNECGISRDDVVEALNHARRGSDRVTDIYIERDFTRVWEANRKVLNLVGECYFFAKK